MGEPFAVHVEIDAERDEDDVLLSVGIDTASQLRVATLRSEEADVRLRLRAGRTTAVRVRVEGLNLAPGCFNVALHLRVGARHADSTAAAATFDVVPAAFDPSRRVDDAPGVVKHWPRWEVADPLGEVSQP